MLSNRFSFDISFLFLLGFVPPIAYLVDGLCLKSEKVFVVVEKRDLLTNLRWEKLASHEHLRIQLWNGQTNRWNAARLTIS